MKHTYPFQKHFLFTLFVSLFLMSCGDKDDDANTDALAEPCNYLTEALVKSTYNLSNDFPIENKPTYGNNPICSYEWEIKKEEIIGTELFQVSLNFSTKGKVSNDQAEQDWEFQDETVYSEYEIEEVNNVGERASWTKLGHGQLRVLYKGYIFYVNTSYRVMQLKDGGPFHEPVVKDHEVMKERAITLAKAVIAKL